MSDIIVEMSDIIVEMSDIIVSKMLYEESYGEALVLKQIQKYFLETYLRELSITRTHTPLGYSQNIYEFV